MEAAPAVLRTILSRSGGEKGLRGSGSGTLGVPLGGTRLVWGLLGLRFDQASGQSSWAISRSLYFCIFCDAVIGKMLRKWTYFGILNHEILSLQNACTSCSESVTPSAGIMQHLLLFFAALVSPKLKTSLPKLQLQGGILITDRKSVV